MISFHKQILKTKLQPFVIKGPGKRGHLVADTLLPMMFLGLCKLGNICCGHKMFLNKFRNISCVPDTKFVSAANVAHRQKGKHLCRQQCVLVCQGLKVYHRSDQHMILIHFEVN